MEPSNNSKLYLKHCSVCGYAYKTGGCTPNHCRMAELNGFGDYQWYDSSSRSINYSNSCSDDSGNETEDDLSIIPLRRSARIALAEQNRKVAVNPNNIINNDYAVINNNNNNPPTPTPLDLTCANEVLPPVGLYRSDAFICKEQKPYIPDRAHTDKIWTLWDAGYCFYSETFQEEVCGNPLCCYFPVLDKPCRQECGVCQRTYTKEPPRKRTKFTYSSQ